MNKFTIIGAGNVGITLSLYLHEKGLLDVLLFKSSESKERALDSGLNDSMLRRIDECNFEAEVIIICVQDKKIEELSDYLTNKKLEGKYIFHTSGLKSYKILAQLSEKNITAAVHPYQTFYNQDPDILKNIGWGISCDQSYFSQISSLIKEFGGKCRYLNDDKKAVYHASAVAASNYLNLLFDISSNLLNEAEIDAADFLPQIMQTTLKNNVNLLDDKKIALTGPIIRKDYETIHNHLSSMRDKETKKAYSNMGISLVMAARKIEILSDEETDKFISIFEEGI